MGLSGEVKKFEAELRDGIDIPGHWLEVIIQRHSDLDELGMDIPIQETSGAVRIERRGITGKYTQAQVREILVKAGRI